MYWVSFFDGSSKVMSDFELNEFMENEDSRDSVVEVRDMDEGITLNTQNLIYNKLH